MKSRIDPREVEVDDKSIPPVRTISVFVPDADRNRVLCSATILDSPEKLAGLDIAPQDGSHTVGDHIHYGWLPGSEFPVVKSGRGQF